MLELLSANPAIFFLLFLCLVMSLSIHEFAHAFMAEKLGDDTPRFQGRVTLNPLAHLDPVGTILILFFGFGWGKPVIFNPYNLKKPFRDTALIAAAGPISNIILAIAAGLLYLVLSELFFITRFQSTFLYYLAFYNMALALFNLIPVNPLDGFKILYGILPRQYSYILDYLSNYGMLILIAIMVTGVFSRFAMPLIINFFLPIFFS